MPTAPAIMTLEAANALVGVGTLALQIATIVLLAVFLARGRSSFLSDATAPVAAYGILIAFVVSLGATVGSLYYSEVLGIAPCSLCWLQRIFLYPQLVLFTVALVKRESRIADYSIALSVLGAMVALYHHAMQMGIGPDLPCPATADQAIHCNVRFLFEMGYITFPLASFSIFAFLIVLMMFVRRR